MGGRDYSVDRVNGRTCRCQIWPEVERAADPRVITAPIDEEHRDALVQACTPAPGEQVPPILQPLLHVTVPSVGWEFGFTHAFVERLWNWNRPAIEDAGDVFVAPKPKLLQVTDLGELADAEEDDDGDGTERFLAPRLLVVQMRAPRKWVSRRALLGVIRVRLARGGKQTWVVDYGNRPVSRSSDWTGDDQDELGVELAARRAPSLRLGPASEEPENTKRNTKSKPAAAAAGAPSAKGSSRLSVATHAGACSVCAAAINVGDQCGWGPKDPVTNRGRKVCRGCVEAPK